MSNQSGNALSREELERVANAILEQLGGRGVCVMTGAKLAIGKGRHGRGCLALHLPAYRGNPTLSRKTVFEVTLNPDDEYDVRFVRATDGKMFHEGWACAENLAEIFREWTGLENRMPRIIRND